MPLAIQESDAPASHLAAARALPLPDFHIPACTAAPIVGINDVVLGGAVEAGFLRKYANGFLLKDHDAFRTTYIFSAEVSKWFHGSGEASPERWQKPDFALHKSNVWRRSEVIQAFGSQQMWNFEPFESATSE